MLMEEWKIRRNQVTCASGPNETQTFMLFVVKIT